MGKEEGEELVGQIIGAASGIQEALRSASMHAMKEGDAKRYGPYWQLAFPKDAIMAAANLSVLRKMEPLETLLSLMAYQAAVFANETGAAGFFSSTPIKAQDAIHKSMGIAFVRETALLDNAKLQGFFKAMHTRLGRL